ncbi:MAG: flagellar basal body P-ring formation chaperone FlgA [Rickettsiales bacterium]|nr:flagellar basal body P-ring formation chaperone FlgA [Rickettsiales bacterium]
MTLNIVSLRSIIVIVVVLMHTHAYGEDDFSVESFLKTSITNQISERYFTGGISKYLSHFESSIPAHALTKIPNDFTQIVDIQVKRFNKKNGSTEVVILYQKDNKIAEHRFHTRIKTFLNVPVLEQKHKKHQVIRSEQIHYKKFPLNRLRSGTIFDAAEIIDKQTSRSVSANSPIRSQHIMQPYLVRKDEIISIVFKNKFMNLKTSGIAMDNGIKGERIRIKNLRSGKIIAGKIIGKSTVSAINAGV